MNERIQQLKIQAFDTVWDLDSSTVGPGTHFIPNGFEEKFAELIVRECAGRVDWILAEGGGTQGDLIREHFGVEL